MMRIKPAILTDEDVKGIKIEQDKFDFVDLWIFLCGVFASGLIGASFGFALLLIS